MIDPNDKMTLSLPLNIDPDDRMTLSLPLNRRGRKNDPNKKVFRSYGLRPDRLKWLELWFPDGNPTDQINALLDRAMKFWPSGPARFR